MKVSFRIYRDFLNIKTLINILRTTFSIFTILPIKRKVSVALANNKQNKSCFKRLIKSWEALRTR